MDIRIHCWESPMRSQTTSNDCRATAAEYRKLAEQVANPVRKSEYELLEQRWLKLARKFEIQERANNSNVLPFRAAEAPVINTRLRLRK